MLTKWVEKEIIDPLLFIGQRVPLDDVEYAYREFNLKKDAG